MMTKNSKSAMANLTASEIEAKMKELKDYNDVRGFLKELVAPTLQGLLEAELEQHLGYPKHHPSGYGSGNSRNGYSSKTLKTTDGEISLNIPRDRNGSYDPQAIKRYENHSQALDDQIITLYGKGNSTRQISEFARETYGVNVSGDMVSSITDKVLPLVEEWQNRPLKKCYPILFLDGIHHKVREGGKIVNKCSYTVLGIDEEGHKDLLGLWVGESESSKFWLSVLNQLKNRGVEDVLIVCIDGLNGFPEAIKAVFPKSEIQLCIIHQVRNTVKFIPHKEKKEFCKDLRTIYTAATEESGFQALQEVKKKWPEYAVYLKSWETNWAELSTFFVYPEEIRKLIYTTNTVEGLHRQFRRVTKTTVIFPHDTSLKKQLWLAQRDISKKWNMPVKNWAKIAAQFSIFFDDRFKI